MKNKKSLKSELRRLLDVCKHDNAEVLLNADGLTDDEAECICLFNEILNEVTRRLEAAVEYDLMKYKLASDALGVGLWDMDIVGSDPGNGLNRLIWSPEVRRIMGFEGEWDFPNVLSSLTDRLHPEDKDRAVNAFVAHVNDKSGKTVFDQEYRLMVKSGEYRTFHAFGTTLRDSDGNPLRVAGAIEDVEDKKRLQESVRKAEQERIAFTNLANIMNSLNVLISVTDPETDDILFVNKSMRNAFSYKGTCSGDKCYEIFQNMDKRCANCPCIKLDQQPRSEIIWEHKNALTKRTYRSYSRYIEWPGGRRVHIQSAVDITDIKNAQEELESQNLRLNLLIGGMNVGLWDRYVDRDLAYDDSKAKIWWSDEFRRLLGYTDESDFPNEIGSWLDSVHPDDLDHTIHAMTAFLDDKTGQIPYDVENRMILKNGQYRWFRSFGSAIRDEQGNPIRVAGATENITERKEAERKLKEALHNAEKANKAKSDFLAKMSHEIRTPMNAILGITEIKLSEASLSADMEEALGKIYDSGNLLMGIINDILDLSKIEADKLEIQPVKYDLSSLVNDTVQLNRLRYESKPIEFTIKLDKNTPHSLFGDELRIKQILNNLLSNAFKYTEKGGIELSISAQFPDSDSTSGNKKAHDDDVILVFRVSDTGQGLTEEQVSMLFTEYMRFNQEANRTTVGTGLGLSITKSLVDLMNGEISVSSSLGEGSVFTVCLPQKRIGATVCGADLAGKIMDNGYQNTEISRRAQFVKEYMPYGSVLVVDDVESNIYVSKGMMLPYGLHIDTAESGFEAIEFIKKGNTYDIIFMDHMMPNMDGIETTKIIRDMGYSGTIVALTANAIVGQAEIFLENGFDSYISKPIDSRELNVILNEFIRCKKPPEVIEAARKAQTEKQKREITVYIEDGIKKSDLTKYVISDAIKAVDILNKTYSNIKSLNETDIELFVITVHGIKSSLANLGERELADAAYMLEMAGKERNIDIVKREIPAFINALNLLIKKASNEHKSNGRNSNDIEIDDTVTNSDNTVFLREKISEVKAACDAYDINAIRNALDELKQKSWQGEIYDIIEEISTHVLHSDFEKAAASAEKVQL